MKTSQDVATHFFEVMALVLSQNTSKSYAVMALQTIKNKLRKDYPFISHIDVNEITLVGSEINRVDNKQIGALFKEVLHMVGSDVLKQYLAQKLDKEDRIYMEKAGVNLSD